MTAALRRFRFPLGALVIALAATAVVASLTERAIHAVDQQRFALAADGLQDAITGRIETYIGMMRAGAGLMTRSRDMPTAEEFHAFTYRLELARRYPGIQGIGFTARILPADVARLVAERRASGDPGFRVWPEYARDEYHAILYLAPLDRRNREAIGYDMFTQPTRRAAMERARDTGEPVASGVVELVQEIDADKQPGFLIYVPVYHGSVVPSTVEERRSKLRGFIYSPFRARDLFDGILGSDQKARAGFALFDGDVETGTLLYETGGYRDPARFAETRSFDVAGQRWTARMFSTVAFERTSSRGLVPWVRWVGGCVSILLTWLVWNEARARERAEVFRARAEEAVSYLRAAEQSLQEQARSAERMSRLKDEFLATLSHELRTPVNAIAGWAHMMNTMQLPQERQAEAIAVISRNAQVQAKLVEDLLDMSRIISGRLVLDMQPMDPADAVAAALNVVRPTADAKRVRLESHASPGMRIMADPARLQQILWNLLINAIKFTPAGGLVSVATTCDGSQAKIVVTDTGMGITRDFLPHVFERFRQADSGFTRSHGGLGIGLSIARNLVEMHAGSIHAHSAGENTGATFTINLPLVHPNAPCAPSGPAT